MNAIVKLAILFIFAACPKADTRNLGTITISGGIIWDQLGTNITKWKVFVGELKPILIGTNLSMVATNFASVSEVTTNRWNGDQTKQWYGPLPLYVTSVDSVGQESDPSEIVIANFRAGIPIPPTNIQLFSVVTASATNALPPVPK